MHVTTPQLVVDDTTGRGEDGQTEAVVISPVSYRCQLRCLFTVQAVAMDVAACGMKIAGVPASSNRGKQQTPLPQSHQMPNIQFVFMASTLIGLYRRVVSVSPLAE
jgi:hypothetical protein